MIEVSIEQFPYIGRCNRNQLICHYSLSSQKSLNCEIASVILDFFYNFHQGKVSLKDGVYRCKFAIFIDLSQYQYTFFLFPFFRYFQEIPGYGKEKLILI